MLVAAGASLLVLDGAGLSSRQLALMAEDLELAEYLKSQEHFQVRLSSINTLRNYLNYAILHILHLITKLTLIF